MIVTAVELIGDPCVFQKSHNRMCSRKVETAIRIFENEIKDGKKILSWNWRTFFDSFHFYCEIVVTAFNGMFVKSKITSNEIVT